MATERPSADDKDEFRAWMMAERAALGDEERRRLDHRLRTHLLHFVDEREFIDIAAYFPFNGEPDLMRALKALHLVGRRIHLPVVNGGAMHFRRWNPDTEMRPNRFGIPEPVEGADIAPMRLELVLMPLVAFAGDGTRLGMGAGFYDRAFAFRLDSPDSDPMMVGTAYSLQKADRLPAEAWDVPMDAVVTDEGVRMFRE